MIDRRSEPRLRTLLVGAISFGRRRSLVDCVVRNLSENGALISLARASLMPREFELAIPQRAETRSATLVWRERETAGLSLAPAPPLRPRR